MGYFISLITKEFKNYKFASGEMMISQFQDEEMTLQGFVDTCKKLFGNNLKAIVLFGSHAQGSAKKYSDYDFLVVAENLPSNWRKRDNLELV